MCELIPRIEKPPFWRSFGKNTVKEGVFDITTPRGFFEISDKKFFLDMTYIGVI
jgi:hypothetical protein